MWSRRNVSIFCLPMTLYFLSLKKYNLIDEEINEWNQSLHKFEACPKNKEYYFFKGVGVLL